MKVLKRLIKGIKAKKKPNDWIVEVRTKSQLRAFVNFQFKLYEKVLLGTSN